MSYAMTVLPAILQQENAKQIFHVTELARTMKNASITNALLLILVQL
jgi:hypothetical protein